MALEAAALFTAEAEFYTASLKALRRRSTPATSSSAQPQPTPVYEDNTAGIEWGGNTVVGGRERAKRIDIRKPFAHEVIQTGHMQLLRVSTTSQLASDILSKPVHFPQYLACVSPQASCQWVRRL